jgi:outer membrane lipoprotein LolB
VRHGAIALLATLTLAGCAAPIRVPDPAVAMPDPAVLRHWTANGRMAFAATGEGGSGSFTWDQVEGETRLDLRGPFGAGGLRIVANDVSLTVQDGGGRNLDAEEARAELQVRLGADLPWTSLRYWMLGVPAPGAPGAVSSAEAGQLRVIEQAEWTIGYDAFTSAAGMLLPRRFTASRGEVRVKVVVDSWSVPSERSAPDQTR